MALSPSIPTSFVPKQTAPANRRSSQGNNIFMLVAIAILALTLLTSGGVFLYAKYLKNTEDSEAAQLIEAKKNVSSDQVLQFIRLKDRLVTAQTIINQHVELSQFFNELEKITLTDVSFTKMSIDVASDRTATLTMAGQANTFNALAAESKIFASEPYIKSAIFSDITTDPTTKMIGFSLTSSLDPHLVQIPSSSTFVAAPAAPLINTSATTSIQRVSSPITSSSSTTTTAP